MSASCYRPWPRCSVVLPAGQFAPLRGGPSWHLFLNSAPKGTP
jgi:hypothetical protein